ncbi:tRNA-splicing_ligase RtcB [Hexamita inflata]|uniref:3'-phosphate/5'-hydroxy nucleic acid ligase n=1 Tax=Hexamita inflata TaxID=28002 RepID=A0AA86R2Y6_9EUKA|nr:tRNA-splicing ligase RtcB [Hexamita inflata]
MNPIIINGEYAYAMVYSDNLQEDAKCTLCSILNCKAMCGSNVAVMPDVHYAGSCVVGFTSTVAARVIPALVGGDIGCGVLCAEVSLSCSLSDDFFKRLDQIIHEHVPAGERTNSNNLQQEMHLAAESASFRSNYSDKKVNIDQLQKLFLKTHSKTSLGSLGSGNHFIELNKSSTSIFMTIHTGSRQLGVSVNKYHCNRAIPNNSVTDYKHIMEEIIEGKETKVPMHLRDFQRDLIQELRQRGMESSIKSRMKLIQWEPCTEEYGYLENEGKEEYTQDLIIAQQFASLNRYMILKNIIDNMLDMKIINVFESTHNYLEDNIIRKGAIKAEGRIIIPINAREGVIIGQGIPKAEWNYSAPHGAGRRLKRKDRFSLEDYQKEMVGIYSTTVCSETADEAPGMYKTWHDVGEWVQQVIQIEQTANTLYNYKGGK